MDTNEQDNQEFADAFAEFAGESTPEIGDDFPAETEEVEQGEVEELEETEEVEAKEEKPEVEEKEEKPKTDAEQKKADKEENVETLKAELAKLQHRERSASGRVGAFQKRINQLERELSSRQEQMLEALKGGDDKQFREDFPEIAEAMDRRSAMLAQEIERRMVARLQPLQEAEQSRYVDSQFAALEAAHPGWTDTVRSDSFKQWLQAQPEQVKTLSRSDSASDADALLKFYKAMNPVSAPAQQARQAVSQPQKNPIQAQRKQALKQSAGIQSSRKPSATSGIPEDFESAFDAFVRMDKR